jgi:hypothetical protein
MPAAAGCSLDAKTVAHAEAEHKKQHHVDN